MSKKKNKKSASSVLPEEFLERLTSIVGLSYFEQIKKTFVQRPTTFRVNTLKAKREEILEILQQQGFKIQRVQWYKDAFILLNKSKRELTELNIYTEGKIYIQSLASMVPPLILGPQPGDKVLDLTAAPGSKTSEIAALMNRTGELVANDNNKVRFFKLKHNLEMLGVIDAILPLGKGEAEGVDEKQKSTTPTPPFQGGEKSWKVLLRMEHGCALAREYPHYFDKILLDAPCSAEARFVIGDPKSTGYWKERKIKEMAYKQWQLLLGAWSALKPGGTMVYSTCTFAPEENELQITKFMERNEDAEIQDIKKILDIGYLPITKEFKGKKVNEEVVDKALRIKPTGEIEGFFVVKIRKMMTNI